VAGHLWVSWDRYHRHIEQLARIVHESGYRFDQAICLARGGLRIGDVFSRVFNVPLLILSVSSYREAGGTQQGHLKMAESISSTVGPPAGRVLLLDDLADSGITLQQVRNHLGAQFPAVTEIRSAVIWYKAHSVVRPDFYLSYLPDSPWIHQPFEVYDGIDI